MIVALQMRVLRSSHEVADISKRLRNCAASFVELIKHDEYLMVVLVQTKTGKPEALGGIHKSGENWEMGRHDGDREHEWDQIVGQSNSFPTTEVLEHFDAFMQQVHLWCLPFNHVGVITRPPPSDCPLKRHLMVAVEDRDDE